MNRRPRRPWDQTPTMRRRKDPVATDEPDVDDPVPFIEIHGVRFWSDRFYLNKTVYDDNDNKNISTRCICGAEGSPPLLDRSQLVASLSIKAALLATYTVDPAQLIQEFPSLFGRDAIVPTLVLHGQKGWTLPRATTTKHDADDDDDDNPESQDSQNTAPLSSSTPPKFVPPSLFSATPLRESKQSQEQQESPQDSLYTQSHELRAWSRQFELLDSPLPVRARAPLSPPVGTAAAADAAQSPFDALNKRSYAARSSRRTVAAEVMQQLSRYVSFTEITTTYVAPDDLPPHPDHVLDHTTGYLHRNVVQRRNLRRGVHHPKFMILWETSGAVVVLVSTANLTEQHSTDGTWVQRFDAATAANDAISIDNGNKRRKTEAACIPASGPPRDFGRVLANFLYCQTLATQTQQLTPLGFMHRYLGYNSVGDLAKSFDFARAQVQLVPIVPGIFVDRLVEVGNQVTAVRSSNPAPRRKKSASTGDENESFSYGRHRVARVLESCRTRGNGRSKCWWPESLVSSRDRLIVQPTSIGMDWNVMNMTAVARSYLVHDSKHASNSPESSAELLRRMDIVWPTLEFVREVRKVTIEGGSDPMSATAFDTGFVRMSELNPDSVTDSKSNEGYLFLSSATFNRIDAACLGQMVMFDPSLPRQGATLTPHVKSVARLCTIGSKRQYELSKMYGLDKCEERLAWLLLTSACLSRGAQGETVYATVAAADGRGDENAESKKAVTSSTQYANFELGVLFCSRLQGRTTAANGDRLYCFRPARCTCRDARTRRCAKLIHLPVPYSLRPCRYTKGTTTNDDDDILFCETPYLHEIPAGTACEGNMLLTPYGAAVAAKASRKSLDRGR